MQFQAGIRGRPIVRPVDLETTALGAAYLTGLAAGVWNGIGELGQFWRAAGVCGPRMSADERESLYAGRPELSATIPSPVESKG
jgi:glycerol kinase